MSTLVDELQLLGLGGSNKVMSGELSRLVRRALSQQEARRLLSTPPRKAGPGALVYAFDPSLAAVAVRYHRTSARVLWGLYQTRQSRLEPLYDELRSAVEQESRSVLSQDASISVLAFSPRSVAAGERQVVGTVKNALIDGAARRGVRLSVQPDGADLCFHVRTSAGADGRDRLVVSLDLAGRPMHQRGYRSQSTVAPLREDLAANLVMLARHDARREPLVDPMAGSGTLCIEAGLMAAGKEVWMSGRRTTAEQIPEFQAIMERIRGPLFADTTPRLHAAELDEHATQALDRNLQTAGLRQQTEVHLGSFEDWNPQLATSDAPGLILCNPPYGARLEARPDELSRLHRELGRWCRQFRGWRAAFLVGESEGGGAASFVRAFGARPRVSKPMRNGPLLASFLLFDL